MRAVEQEGVALLAAADAAQAPGELLQPDAHAPQHQRPELQAEALVQRAELDAAALAPGADLLDLADHRVEGGLPVLHVVAVHVAEEVVVIEQAGQAVPLGAADQVAVLRQLDAAGDAGLDDLAGGVGLGDEVHGPDLQAVQLGLLVHGEEDHRDVHELLVGLHPGHQLPARHVRHVEVQQHDGDAVPVGLQELQRLDAVGGEQDVVVLPQHVPQHLPADVLVVHDQDALAEVDDRKLLLHRAALRRPRVLRLAQALQHVLLLVHGRVGPVEHRADAPVPPGVVDAAAEGHHGPAPLQVRQDLLLEEAQQLLPVRVVLALQDRGELVAADAVDGAVLEADADQAAGLPDQLVPGLVAAAVVDLLEVVQVKDHDAEGGDLPLADPPVHALPGLLPGVLALHAGQGVGVCHLHGSL